MSQTLWLRIDKQESLLQPGLIEISWEPIFLKQVEMLSIKEYRKKCDKNAYEFTINSFKHVMDVFNHKKGALTPLSLKNAGNSLYNNFVDDGFYKGFRDSKCHEIYISTRMIYVPWELVTCRDGDELPWGIKYSIGNQVRSPLDGREKLVPAYKEHINVLLIGANTRKDLRFVEEEIETVKKRLLEHERIRCEILLVNPPEDNAGDRVSYFPLTYDNMLSKLQESKFDIVHYAGHIEPPDKNDLGSALVLEVDKDSGKNKLLYSKTIYENLGGTPFVFLNGCSLMWEEAPLVITTIADGFILGGARGVVVPRTPVYDDDAMSIAINYYDKVLSGETFGEALRQVREEEYNKDKSSINWLTYILFGKPDARIISLEREIFLSDTQLRAKILNERIFENDALVLVKLANFYALKNESKRVEPEYLTAAFTHSEIFARIYADLAEDDLWRVLKELRIQLFGKEIKLSGSSEYENLPVKEELMSGDLLEVLKNAHSICEAANQFKIRAIDLCQAIVKCKKEKLTEAVQAIANKFKLTKLASLEDIEKAVHEIVIVQEKTPESLIKNLFNRDGRINKDFITRTVERIFAKCAFFRSLRGEKLLPDDIFWISGILPDTNTKNFFDKEQLELAPVAIERQQILLQKIEKELELTAEDLMPATEEILKRAARMARWEGLKLSEKHLIRSVIEFVSTVGGEDFPSDAFLEKLELDTISWIENE